MVRSQPADIRKVAPIARFVRYCFGLEALDLIRTVPGVVFALIYFARVSFDPVAYRSWHALPFLGLTAASLVVDLAAARAWWTLRKAKPSARGWALAASILNIALAIPVGALMDIRVALIGCALGVAGLIAFWRPFPEPAWAAVPRKPAKLSGDGTSRIADAAVWAVATGALWFQYFLWHRWNLARHLGQESLPLIVLVELAILLAAAGHELGHAIAGWVSDMTLRSFRVGPFAAAVRNGHWRFRFDINGLVGGGATGMIANGLRNVRSRHVFMIAGGPAGSLVVALGATVLALSAAGNFWRPAWTLLAMTSAIAWTEAVVNLIPHNPSGLYSDGAQVYQLVTLGPWADVHLATAMASSSLINPSRPRDWDIGLLTRAAESVPRGAQGLLLRCLAGHYFVDTKQFPQAISCLEAAETLFDEARLRNPADFLADFVFLNAAYKRDPAAAERWWSRLEACRKSDRDADYWRAAAAIFWVRGETQQARDAWERGHALAARLPRCGAYDFSRDAFEYLREVLETPTPELLSRLPVSPPLPVPETAPAELQPQLS
jgi:hypothetical protein